MARRHRAGRHAADTGAAGGARREASRPRRIRYRVRRPTNVVARSGCDIPRRRGRYTAAVDALFAARRMRLWSRTVARALLLWLRVNYLAEFAHRRRSP